MSPTHTRGYVLTLLLLTALLVAYLVLSEVLSVVFVAVTVGYVLYPLRRALVERGVSPRVASAGLTALLLVGLVVVVSPLFIVIYRRLPVVVQFLQTLPETITIGVEGFTYVVESDELVSFVRQSTSRLGARLARLAPVLALELTLFVFLVYELLNRPTAVREISDGLVPPTYRDVIESFHERTRTTLYGIYVVQAATSVLTFLVALPVFYLLGYRAFFSLAVVAGVLQFIPILGPSIVVGGLALYEFSLGQPVRALIVLAVGLVVVGFLPDAVLRPQLATRTAGMPVSAYFLGFVGGVLGLGAVGIIAGPLVVAFVLVALDLLTSESRESAVGQ